MAKNEKPTDAQVIKLLKQHPGQSMQYYANQLGIALGAVGGYVYRLESEADPSLQVKATTDAQIQKAVLRMRDTDGLRWERIGARLRPQLSAAKVKEAYKAAGGDPDNSYTGRGRPAGSASTSGGKKASGSTGRQAAGTGRGTSGRRAQAGTGRAAGRQAAQTGRAAGRRTRGGSPS